ncbi:MFS transporter [Paenibacillus radicis (ex Gao et al. 2016)]|uniref:MFS-type transporter YbcL n=1 Tax=Paenibacillus radicis (ex Gao et al. 2016) TaxID=1737354 RepID=A0A917GPR1_9BACL|nr:MFS transporter [Paenibacillus radicis (ex Gao et al. 2016)]GGG53718.1 putative MFS-type transporter YbcL [Paenibacillus radicis (ex Gao et al. 2016)]
MNRNRMLIYILMIAVFFTATSELVVTGILNVLAEQMNISVALAGQLITAYSLAFAIGTPVIVPLTARMGRKKLLLIALFVFIAGNLISFASSSFIILLVARIILGVSSGVFMVAAFGAAARLVPPEKIGSVMGTIILGFSSAMIVGVPLGIALTEAFGWQTIFLFLAIGGTLIVIVMIGLLPEIEGDAPVPFRRQFTVLANPVILFALLFVLFREAGNSVMFTYVTTFLGTILNRSASAIGLIMLLFGIAGAIGSRLGGSAVDKWGSVRLILIGIAAHIIALAFLPLAIHSYPLAIALLAMWVMSMFIMGPATQTYFIERAPQSTNLIISLNTSVTQVGLAAGAGAGGMAVTMNATVLYNPWVASIALLLSLAAAIVSIRKSAVMLMRG